MYSQETQLNGSEQAFIPDAAASESGLRAFAKKLNNREQITETTTDNPESLKPLAKEAWYLARNLEKWAKASQLPEHQRTEIKKMQELVRQFADRLSSFIEFQDPSFREGQNDKEILKLALNQIKKEINNIQHKIDEAPVESKLNPKRIRDFIKRAAIITGLLGAATGIRESKKYLDTKAVQEAKLNEQQKKQNGEKAENLIKHRSRRHRADMRGEGEPGEFPTGSYFAKVDFSWGSKIDDPLWATELTYRANPDDFFSVQPRQGAATAESQKTQAEVTMQPMSVKAGEIINLPVPVGYKVSWVGTNNNDLFASYGDANHTVFFDKSAENVSIRYGVEESNENYDLPEPSPYDLYRTPATTKTINELRQPETNIPQILNRHFSDFTYITSDELQDLLDALPGTLEEKTGALKIGDCDMLANYGAGLLNDAGKKSMVALGILEQHHKLDAARPHGKLVFFDKNEKPHTFETTSATKKQYVNLKFLPEDKAKLEAIVSKAASGPATREQIAGSLEEFRTELENILNSVNYKRYEAKNGFHENPGLKDLVNLLAELPKNLLNTDLPDSVVGKIELAIVGLLAIILFDLGLIKVTVSGLNLSSRKLKKAQDKSALNFLKKTLETEPFPPDQAGMDAAAQETALMHLVESEYLRQPNFEKIYPLAEVKLLNFAQKTALVKFLRVYNQLTVPEPELMDGWRSSLLANIQWRALINRAEADGLNLETVTEAIRSLMIDKRMQKEFMEEIPKYTQTIFDKGKEKIVSMVESLDKIGKASRENIFKYLEITEQAGANSERTAKRRAKIEPSIEFFDHAPYSPGMDTRSIDWRAYMRTDKLYVKRSPENAMPNHETSTFNLFVDSSTSEQELADLAALLLYAQKHPKELSLSSITLAHDGQFIERMDAPTAQMLLRDGPQAIKKLIEKVLIIRSQHAIEAFKHKRYEGYSALTYPIPLQLYKPGEKLLTVGIPDVGEQFRGQYRIFKFRQPREE